MLKHFVVAAIDPYAEFFVLGVFLRPLQLMGQCATDCDNPSSWDTIEQGMDMAFTLQ